MSWDITNLQDQLERNGYFILENFFSETECSAALETILPNIDSQPFTAEHVDRRYFGVEMLTLPEERKENSALVAIGKKTENAGVLQEVLGEPVRWSYGSWHAYLPHRNQFQGWHTDTDPDDLPYFGISCLPLLQPQQFESGLTHMVPGSHRVPLEKALPPRAKLPGQVTAEVPAGSLCCLNGLTWHMASENLSDTPRVVCNHVARPARFTGPDWHQARRARMCTGRWRFGTPFDSDPAQSDTHPWKEHYTQEELASLFSPNRV